MQCTVVYCALKCSLHKSLVGFSLYNNQQWLHFFVGRRWTLIVVINNFINFNYKFLIITFLKYQTFWKICAIYKGSWNCETDFVKIGMWSRESELVNMSSMYWVPWVPLSLLISVHDTLGTVYFPHSYLSCRPCIHENCFHQFV